MSDHHQEGLSDHKKDHAADTAEYLGKRASKAANDNSENGGIGELRSGNSKDTQPKEAFDHGTKDDGIAFAEASGGRDGDLSASGNNGTVVADTPDPNEQLVDGPVTQTRDIETADQNKVHIFDPYSRLMTDGEYDGVNGHDDLEDITGQELDTEAAEWAALRELGTELAPFGYDNDTDIDPDEAASGLNPVDLDRQDLNDAIRGNLDFDGVYFISSHARYHHRRLPNRILFECLCGEGRSLKCIACIQKIRVKYLIKETKAAREARANAEGSLLAILDAVEKHEVEMNHLTSLNPSLEDLKNMIRVSCDALHASTGGLGPNQAQNLVVPGSPAGEEGTDPSLSHNDSHNGAGDWDVESSAAGQIRGYQTSSSVEHDENALTQHDENQAENIQSLPPDVLNDRDGMGEDHEQTSRTRASTQEIESESDSGDTGNKNKQKKTKRRHRSPYSHKRSRQDEGDSDDTDDPDFNPRSVKRPRHSLTSKAKSTAAQHQQMQGSRSTGRRSNTSMNAFLDANPSTTLPSFQPSSDTLPHPQNQQPINDSDTDDEDTQSKASVQSSAKKQQGPKKAGLTDADMACIIQVVRTQVQEQDAGRRTKLYDTALWNYVKREFERIQRKNVSPNALRMLWARQLRAQSGVDERKVKNSKNMQTCLQDK